MKGLAHNDKWCEGFCKKHAAEKGLKKPKKKLKKKKLKKKEDKSKSTGKARRETRGDSIRKEEKGRGRRNEKCYLLIFFLY